MDMKSFFIGLQKGFEDGAEHVVLDGTGYTFSDPNNDGHVIIEEVQDGNETAD